MNERTILMSGIGGQGVQLAAKTLAYAAIASGFEVMVFGTYGGSMRGGNTDSAMVIGRGPIRTPPVLDASWSALVMHHESWASLSAKLLPGGIALIDSSVFRGDFGLPDVSTVPLPATEIAQALESSRAGSMVALGAFNAITAMVPHDALMAAAGEVLPPYRAQHIEANQNALRAGQEAVAGMSVPAWPVAMETI